MSVSLEGKTALITGSGRGIGRAHAVLMASRGANIVVHDIIAENVEETAELVRAEGAEAETIVSDIREVAPFTEAVKAADAKVGGIDILVNNAGIGGNRLHTPEIDQEIFDAMFEIQVRGTFFATQAVLPGMQARNGGKIVNTSSIYAMGGFERTPHYCASKSAISGLTKSWAKEFARWKINVNAVAPGFVSTPMTQGSNSADQIAERGKGMPLGRLCEPEDIAYTVAWLASSEADMMTGQIVSPNSGEVIVGY